MTDPFVYTGAPSNLGSAASHVAALPPALVGREALFDALTEALRLPGYFGRNWDALSDLLTDLGWLDERRVILFHSQLPSLVEGELNAYLELLGDAVRNWHDQPGAHELIVAFPPSDIERVRAAILAEASPSRVTWN